jgi:hypothetical protein
MGLTPTSGAVVIGVSTGTLEFQSICTPEEQQTGRHHSFSRTVRAQHTARRSALSQEADYQQQAAASGRAHASQDSTHRCHGHCVFRGRAEVHHGLQRNAGLARPRGHRAAQSAERST